MGRGGVKRWQVSDAVADTRRDRLSAAPTDNQKTSSSTDNAGKVTRSSKRAHLSVPGPSASTFA